MKYSLKNIKSYNFIVFCGLFCCGIAFLVSSIFIHCEWERNVFISIGAGIISSSLVSFLFEVYQNRSRENFYTYFWCSYSQCNWYIVKITCIFNLNINTPICLNFVSKALAYCKYFISVADKSFNEALTKFLNKKFCLNKNFIKRIYDFFDSYKNLKNCVKSTDFDTNENNENNEKLKKSLIDFKEKLEKLKNYLPLKLNNFNAENLQDSEKYIESWTEYNKNLKLLLNKDDFKTIEEVK